jgi:DNA-directed RNA polymerase specialized sigma subunit
MAIVLHGLEELSEVKVGEVMGVSASRISQLCHNGYRRMRPAAEAAGLLAYAAG